MKSFGSGAMNWVVIPSPSICFYIISFILINFIFSIKLVEQQNAYWACILAFNLLMLAAAFGRCDPWHILYNGLGIFICTWAILAYINSKYFKLYSILFFLVFVIAMNFTGFLSYKENIGMAAVQKFKESPTMISFITKATVFLDQKKVNKLNEFLEKEKSQLDTNLLGQYKKVALPFYVDKSIYLYLFKKGTYAPEFYTDVLNVGNKKQILDKLKALQDEDHRYMIIPEKYFTASQLYAKSETEENKFISSLFLFPFYYHKVSDSRSEFEPIHKYIIDQYKPVKIIKQGYILVERKGM